MKTKRASRTAQMVTMGRALADAGVSHVEHFSDPTARVFLSEKAKQRIAKVAVAARGSKKSLRVEASRVSADLMALRTTAIDTAVQFYLHCPTGRVLPISEEALAAAENADEEWVTPEELADARAFRHFKDTVHYLGVAQAWYDYRDECFRRVARDWCEAEGVEFED